MDAYQRPAPRRSGLRAQDGTSTTTRARTTRGAGGPTAAKGGQAPTSPTKWVFFLFGGESQLSRARPESRGERHALAVAARPSPSPQRDTPPRTPTLQAPVTGPPAGLRPRPRAPRPAHSAQGPANWPCASSSAAGAHQHPRLAHCLHCLERAPPAAGRALQVRRPGRPAGARMKGGAARTHPTSRRGNARPGTKARSSPVSSQGPSGFSPGLADGPRRPLLGMAGRA